MKFLRSIPLHSLTLWQLVCELAGCAGWTLVLRIKLQVINVHIVQKKKKRHHQFKKKQNQKTILVSVLVNIMSFSIYIYISEHTESFELFFGSFIVNLPSLISLKVACGILIHVCPVNNKVQIFVVQTCLCVLPCTVSFECPAAGRLTGQQCMMTFTQSVRSEW